MRTHQFAAIAFEENLSLRELASSYPGAKLSVRELHFASEDISREVARGCAARGLLFTRTAYNFVSVAHEAAAGVPNSSHSKATRSTGWGLLAFPITPSSGGPRLAPYAAARQWQRV